MAKRELIPQAEYARRREVSREAVSKRTTTRGGPIPVYGKSKRIDANEADALWFATMDPVRQRQDGKRAKIPAPEPAETTPEPAPAAAAAAQDAVDQTLDEGGDAGSAAQGTPPATRAKIASAIIRAQKDRIELDRIKGNLIDKKTALRQAFNFSRRMRDAWSNWPQRVGPEMAAALGVDPHLLTTEMEKHVRRHLSELADNDELDL